MDGTVGIGTDNPQSALHVAGTRSNYPQSAGVHMGMNNNDCAIEICSKDVSGNSFIDFNNDDNSNTDLDARILCNTLNRDLQFCTGGNNVRMKLTKEGYVGIGTDNPQSALHVAGPIKHSPQSFGVHMGTESNGNCAIEICCNGNDRKSFIDFNNNNDDSNEETNDDDADARILCKTNKRNLEFCTGGATTRMTLDNQGNLGIGKSNPTQKLEVDGNTLLDGDLNVTGYVTIKHADNNNGQLLVKPVDYGTYGGKTGRITIQGYRNTSTINNCAQLLFENYDQRTPQEHLAGHPDIGIRKLGMISGVVSYPGNNIGALAFYNYIDGETESESMRITKDGYVGIGTDNPQSALHVAGPTQ